MVSALRFSRPWASGCRMPGVGRSPSGIKFPTDIWLFSPAFIRMQGRSRSTTGWCLHLHTRALILPVPPKVTMYCTTNGGTGDTFKWPLRIEGKQTTKKQQAFDDKPSSPRLCIRFLWLAPKLYAVVNLPTPRG